MREMMEAAPNIISSRTIAIATIFGDTMTHIKEVMQSFTDTARAGILEAITPYILAAKEWLDINREFIKVKIQQFIQKTAGLIQKMIPTVVKIYTGAKNFIAMIKPFVTWALDNLPKIIPVVAGIAGAFMLRDGVMSIVEGITGAISLLTSPMGIVLIAIAAAIAGFIVLASKVGGVDEALGVLARTAQRLPEMFQNWLAHPLQSIIMNFTDGIRNMLSLINKLPGVDFSAQIRGLEELQRRFAPDVFTLRQAFVAEYDDSRGRYLANHPEENPEESKWGTLVSKFEEMIKAQMGTTSAVEGLADNGGPNSPANLRWGAMGKDDYWDTARLGI
jgi:hypothetical protein